MSSPRIRTLDLAHGFFTSFGSLFKHPPPVFIMMFRELPGCTRRVCHRTHHMVIDLRPPVKPMQVLIASQTTTDDAPEMFPHVPDRSAAKVPMTNKTASYKGTEANLNTP